jgi:hypothetical protein
MPSVLASVRSRFAHLAGRTTPEPAPVEAPPAPAPATETAVVALTAEEQEEEARKAEDEENETRKSRKARRARRAKKDDAKDDDDADDAGDDDEDDDDDDKMKKAEAAGHGSALDAAFRSGARAQRRRCAAIFAAPAATQNLTMAATLAFETSLTADKAEAVLEQAPAPQAAKPGLAARMAAALPPRIGAGAPAAPTGPAKVAASWDHAMGEFGAAAKK